MNDWFAQIVHAQHRAGQYRREADQWRRAQERESAMATSDARVRRSRAEFVLFAWLYLLVVGRS